MLVPSRHSIKNEEKDKWGEKGHMTINKYHKRNHIQPPNPKYPNPITLKLPNPESIKS